MIISLVSGVYARHDETLLQGKLLTGNCPLDPMPIIWQLEYPSPIMPNVWGRVTINTKHLVLSKHTTLPAEPIGGSFRALGFGFGFRV